MDNEILRFAQNDSGEAHNGKIKIAVAMSGGVDSSVAAKILKDQGYDTIGIFFLNQKNDLKMSNTEYSASARARRDGLMSNKIPNDKIKKIKNLYDAHKVAEKLNIPLYVVDVSDKFKKDVIDYFLNEYKNLRTPNPCVVCNEKIKFGWLLDFAKSVGCQYLATGHYARIVDDSGSNQLSVIGCQNGNTTFHLLKAKDGKKDQSYFLYRLNQSQLSKVIFPLGEYTKDEVRAMAKKWKLPIYQKKDSQEVCFIADNDIEKYLKTNLPAKYFKPGEIVDMAGNVIGEHEGLVNYTIGQRKGIEQKSKIKNQNYGERSTLGLSGKKPLYVIGFDEKKNRLIVGEDREIYQNEMSIKDVHFINLKFKNFNLKLRNLTVKIRYRQPAVKISNIIDLGWREPRRKYQISNLLAGEAGKNPNSKSLKANHKQLTTMRVVFSEKQRAITPGQSAVFYLKDEVIGGGIISNM